MISVGGRQLAVGVKVVVDRTNLHVTRRQNQIAVIHGPDDIHDTEFVRLQLQWIDIDHDLPVTAAEGLRHRSTGHIRDLVAHVVLTEIAKLSLVQPLSLEGDQAHGQAGSVKLQNHRWQSAGRELSQVRHGQIRNFAQIRIRIRPWLKIDLDQADARQGARLDVINIAAQREETFEAARNVSFNLFGRHPRVKSGNYNHRNVDRWKQVHRHASQHSGAHDGDDQTTDNDEVWILNRKT